VFPLPLATKNWWDGTANAPFIALFLELASLGSIAVYGLVAYRRYRGYRRWLDDNRTDGVDFDPNWIRNFLIALAGVGVIWLGFAMANWLNPARNFFDQFWLYVVFSALVIYLGLAGWRHSETSFPKPSASAPAATPRGSTDAGRNWVDQGRRWLDEIDEAELWRDPDLTLASLARRLGTNTAYLSRGLNEGAGENLNAIINRRRVAAVQQWLAAPTETRDMLSLALDAGFSSKASFNRAFVDFAGMSPTAWRLKSQKLQGT
jgi:AraC-like DNA-binding protein